MPLMATTTYEVPTVPVVRKIYRCYYVCYLSPFYLAPFYSMCCVRVPLASQCSLHDHDPSSQGEGWPWIACARAEPILQWYSNILSHLFLSIQNHMVRLPMAPPWHVPLPGHVRQMTEILFCLSHCRPCQAVFQNSWLSVKWHVWSRYDVPSLSSPRRRQQRKWIECSACWCPCAPN